MHTSQHLGPWPLRGRGGFQALGFDGLKVACSYESKPIPSGKLT